MSQPLETGNSAELKPLPYLEDLRAYLKAEEPEIWRWFASNRVGGDQADSVRFDLLKSTYRVDRESQPKLYEAAEDVKRKLSLDVPVTIYQAQNPAGLNAALAFVPNEAHVVFHGPLTSKLSNLELRALLAHELSHLLLWRAWDGEYMIVDQILAAMTHDRSADTSHFASARLLALYKEIFCDRGSLFVVEDSLAVVSMLVKVHTALEDVSAESYIRQAEEVFKKQQPKSDQFTHPEAFIRARAVKLWADGDKDADAKIAAMIEGADAIDQLDLLGQRKVSGLTRRMLNVLLAPSWMQTELMLGHAKLFFDDYQALEGKPHDATLADDIKTDDQAMQDYYCYVLLDFVTTDRDLEELPLAAALVLGEQLGLKERFAEIARKELRLRKKQLEKIDSAKSEILSKAAETVATPQ